MQKPRSELRCAPDSGLIPLAFKGFNLGDTSYLSAIRPRGKTYSIPPFGLSTIQRRISRSNYKTLHISYDFGKLATSIVLSPTLSLP